MPRGNAIPNVQFQVSDTPELRLQKLRRLSEALDTLSNMASDALESAAPGDTMVGLSVLGRSIDLAGAGQPIVAAADGAVLRRSGATLGFGNISVGVISGFNAGVQAAITVQDSDRIDLGFTSGQLSADLVPASVTTPFLADDAVDNAKLRDSAALSVIGRASNSAGDPADIAAAVDGHVLGRVGATLAFGQVVTAGITDNAVSNAKLRDSAGVSVIGRAANTVGDPADIVATADNQYLARIAGALTFVALSSASIPDFTEAAQDAAAALIDSSPRISWAYSDVTDSLVGDLIVNSVADIYLADMAQSRIKGRAAGAGVGDPTDLTGAEVLDILEPNAAIWTNTHEFTFTGAGAAAVTLNSTDPRMHWIDSNGGVNAKIFELDHNAGLFELRTLTDAGAAGATGLSIDHTGGTTIATTYLQGTAVQLRSGATTELATGADFVNVLTQLRLTGVNSPAQITANQNDYAGINGAFTVARISSDASRNITGATGGVAGRIAIFLNVGSQNIVFTHNDLASSAGTRFQNANAGNKTVLPLGSIGYWYDGTNATWRQLFSIA